MDQRWLKTSDGTHRERVKYGYDRANNREWRQNVVAGAGQDEFYTYDGLYQLKTLKRGTLNGNPPATPHTGIIGTPSWEEQFNYDPTGNWGNGTDVGSVVAYLTKTNGTTDLSQKRAHNKVNEVTDISETVGTAWPTPTQNTVGNITLMPQPGSLGSSYDAKYDAWNRLVEVKITAGAVQGTYAYDGLNRRVSKTVSGTTRHFYFSKEWQILEERVGASSTADRQFVWGQRYLDDLVLHDKGSERLYVLHDFFHPTAVMVSSTVQERYGYDAFGTPRYMDGSFGSRSSSNYGWETLFAAYRYDLESSLYQVRHRYLHPKLGRWLSRDPLAKIEDRLLYTSRTQPATPVPGREEARLGRGGGLNLYGVVLNNAQSRVDPFGLISFSDNPVSRLLLSPICILAEGYVAKYESTGASQSYAHCLASCRIKRQCGRAASPVAGFLKEAWDLVLCLLAFGQNDPHCYSAFQPGDFEDNRVGMECPPQKSCQEHCRNLRIKNEPPPGPFYRILPPLPEGWPPTI